MLELFS